MQDMVLDKRNDNWDWNKSRLNVQEVNGQLVSGNNRRLAAIILVQGKVNTGKKVNEIVK